MILDRRADPAKESNLAGQREDPELSLKGVA